MTNDQKKANIAEEHRSGNKAVKAQLIGRKVKLHLFAQMNDVMSSLVDKTHWSHKFSTINVFCQTVYIREKISVFKNIPIHFPPDGGAFCFTFFLLSVLEEKTENKYIGQKIYT